MSIRLRRLNRGSDHLRPFAAEHLVEGAGELGVVVAEQKPDRKVLIVQVHRDVSCLLGHPCRVGVGRDPGENDPPATEVDEEQHKQRLEPDRLHREEVARHDPLGLGSQELRPARSKPTRRRAQAVSS